MKILCCQHFALANKKNTLMGTRPSALRCVSLGCSPWHPACSQRLRACAGTPALQCIAALAFRCRSLLAPLGTFSLRPLGFLCRPPQYTAASTPGCELNFPFSLHFSKFLFLLSADTLLFSTYFFPCCAPLCYSQFSPLFARDCSLLNELSHYVCYVCYVSWLSFGRLHSSYHVQILGFRV
jgi:hypothetical protein